jgi:imidazolonepropionase-like amidohydrolase
MFRTFVVSAVIWSLAATAGHSATIIHAGRLIDGRGDEIRSEVSVVIDEGRIIRVASGYFEPQKDDTLISLRDHTVMPGLMDMHTHLMSQHSKDSYTEKFYMDQAEYALRSTVYARATLMAGFTTVRDLGDNGVNSVALRKAINQGWIPGPRIFTAGKSLATTGGHADPTNAIRGDYRRDAGPVEGVINGVDDARKAVRQRYKDGADLIKLTATGGVLSLATNGQNPQFTDEEIRSVVYEASTRRTYVMAHCHTDQDARRCVENGVRSIEHGTLIESEKTAAIIAGKGAFVVPTLSVVDVLQQHAGTLRIPAESLEKLGFLGDQMFRAIEVCSRAGVKLGLGTDLLGHAFHPQQGGELAYLIRHDPAFRGVRREHLEETGRKVRLRANIPVLVDFLERGVEGYQFSLFVISAAPREVI